MRFFAMFNYPKRSFLILIFCLGFLTLKAQTNIPVGTWRTHFSYFQVKSIAESDQYIYAASEKGLFRINPENQISQAIGKIQGLSETAISKLSFHPELSTLIIAYESGNIDLVDAQGTIINVDDIVRSSSVAGSKRINHIYIKDDFAFLSCDFGLVKLDVKKIEIAEDYRNLSFGNNSQIQVFSSTVNEIQDSIYLSTSQGVMQAPFDELTNLQDVNNWRLFNSADNLPSNGFFEMVSLDSSVFVSRMTSDSAYLYQYKNGTWNRRYPGLGAIIRRLKLEDGKMALLTANTVQIWDNEDTFSTALSDINSYPLPSDFIIDQSGKYWISSPDRGVVSNVSGDFLSYNPNGPITDLVARMTYYDDKIVVASGGRRTNFTQQLNEFGYSVYENGQWTNYLPKDVPNTNNFGYFMRDLYEPYFYRSGNVLAIGSIGYGMLMQYDADSFFVFNQNNSTLYNIDPNGFPSTRVTALTENKNGELVVANVESPTPINFYSPENGWRTLNFGASNLDRVDEMLTDNGGNIWCRIINITGGMIVFNEDEFQIRNLNTAEGNGNLPDNSVNTMAIDLEGDIWIGTNDGVAVFFNPENIFSGGRVDASTPIFENRPLLREEIITSIKVDPANRKWVGTNNGVWLFGPDGTSVVANFTENNSPLISNRILDIEINEESGEVFFATFDGIVSYRGTATASRVDCDNIEVFPNPVLPGYEGLVAIKGVPDNSIVKIVDMNGKLFYETNATGNSAVWNGRNYNNTKPKPGMYMILTSSVDGEETCNTKIAILD